MLGATLQPEIEERIAQRDFATLKSVLAEMEIHDLTELLGELEDEELAVSFRLLSRSRAAEIFGDLPAERREAVLSTLSSDKLAGLINEMPPDERTDLLEELPGEIAQRLLNLLRGNEREVTQKLMAYPEDSIGRLMTPEYVAVRPGWTIERVLQHLRRVAHHKETINVIYVVDDRWHLLDDVQLEKLVLCGLDETVEDLLDGHVAALQAKEDQEEALEIFRKYDAVAMPVVNDEGVMVGIVTVDDILDVAEEEAAEDYSKLTAMDPLEHSYFGTNLLGMLKLRLPWLILLLGAQSLTAVALSGFHHVAAFAALVVFVPLINSPAGNAGTQIAGVVLRGLAVQELSLGDWLTVLVREVGRGIFMGALLGAMGMGIVLAFQQPSAIALAVGIAILLAVSLANIIGSMLPFFFKRIGMDPAVTSGPFIASMMDVS
ncbi:MAG: magnesium transporter, partial [Planctomycetota bacterium]